MNRPISFCRLAMMGVALSMLSPAGAIAEPHGKFDGIYKVDVITQRGSCDRYHWTVAVANGHVSSSDAGMIHIVGLINRSGGVSLSFRGDSELARAGGRIRGARGSGTWTSPTLACGGTWQAQRES